MKSNARRIANSSKVLLGVILLACTAMATAQTPATETEELAQVSRDGVFIRSGPADSYYPFGRMKRGDVIKIVGRKHDWVRVATTGPAFADYFGYIKVDRSGRPVLEVEGEVGRTLGRVDVLGANVNDDYAPQASWKRIVELPPDVVIRVLETIETERAIYHRVVLPAEAQGWISRGFVVPASAEQIVAWKVMMRPTDEVVVDETVVIETATTEIPVVAVPDGAIVDLEPIDGADVVVTNVPATDVTEAMNDITGTEAATDVLARDEPAIEPIDAEPDDVTAAADRLVDDIVGDAAIVSETVVLTDPNDGSTVTVTADTIEMTIGGADETPAPDPETGVRRVDIEADELPGTMPPHKKEHQSRLEELELAYSRLKREPIETAEVAPLRSLYLDLAVEAEPRSRVARFSEARAEQLSIWGELQERRIEINKLRKRLLMTTEEAEAVRLALAMHSRYVGVGRLTMSTVYTGNHLPNLIRLQDAGTGRTLAYIYVNNDPGLLAMVGQIVGIVGEKKYDGDLRLNIIEVDRIDLLTPQGVVTR